MKTYCSTAAISFALLLPNACNAQTITNNVPEAVVEGSEKSWAFTASFYGYLVPDSRDYANLNLIGDHSWFHFEARYNYESLETGSLWLGYNFHFGEELVFQATPMLGGVFGNLTGIAPGWNLGLEYKHFSLFSQSEYVFDVGDSSGNFYYNWSELTYSPLEWLRAGLVIQRTKLYKTDLDVQRGFLVGISYRRIDFAAYVFNLGWTDPTIVVATAFSF